MAREPSLLMDVKAKAWVLGSRGAGVCVCWEVGPERMGGGLALSPTVDRWWPSIPLRWPQSPHLEIEDASAACRELTWRTVQGSDVPGGQCSVSPSRQLFS